MSKQKATDNIERYTAQRMLPVPLDQETRAAKGDELASIIGEHQRIEDEFRDIKADFNSRLKDKMAQATEMAKEMNEGRLDLVDVDVVKDHTHNRIVETRTDTGEFITDRAMTAEDRQVEVPTGGDNGTVPPSEPPFETDAQRNAFSDLDNPEQQAALAAAEGRPDDVPAPPAD